MSKTVAVKISDAEISRQAANSDVYSLRDLANRGLYLRFAQNRARGSWYLLSGRKWHKIGEYPGLNTKQVSAALPDVRLRVSANAGAEVSEWVTVGALLAWFAERMAKDRNLSDKRKKTAASAIKCHLVPRLGDVPLAGLDRQTLDRLLMWPMQETLTIDFVRLVFQLLALAFRQAMRLKLIAVNPMQGIKFSDFSKAKVRVKPARLRGVQLADLLARLTEEHSSKPGDAVLALMMLCHGSRIGETRQARWAHISLAEHVWFIPADRAKTRVEHHLPLTNQVCSILSAYRAHQQAGGYHGEFLFPARNGKPLSESQASAVFKRMGQGEWTSHDLRKLARTGWADLGVDHLIGELLLNHAMGHNVKVYIQSDVMSRKRAALELWCAHLDSKGFGLIHGYTSATSGDSGNALQATDGKGCAPVAASTIGEDSK
ncbi:site-specific integrase [Pseudomonas sp. GD03860]|uniref:tyrosine-type recombinase/integrase n=1 Tax=Pseudomonas sp. GD03860 TaxID=2975389 RepID=UPI00244D5703|nr:site-specific integrase [Pseudomonas sp. GD03860]MDH0640636.1 site-specific integrase [Pseudomonas sp. GD03860]